jgi:hypothetical protein
MKRIMLVGAAALALATAGVTGALAQHRPGGFGGPGRVAAPGNVRGNFAPRGNLAPNAGVAVGRPNGFVGPPNGVAANRFPGNRFAFRGRRRFFGGGFGLYAYAGPDCAYADPYDYDYGDCSYVYGPGYGCCYGPGYGW